MKDTDQHIQWKLTGMTCASCAGRVEKFLKGEGMGDVTVDFGEGDVQFSVPVDLDLDLDKLAMDLQKVGYRVIDVEREKAPFLTLNRKLIIAAVFTLPLIISHSLVALGHEVLHLPKLVQALLTLPVMIIGWDHFGKSAWHALKAGTTNMDVLIAAGSTLAFFYSLYVWWAVPSEMVFFEAAASIISLVLLGNYLEKRALKNANQAVRSASEAIPDHARILDPNGNLREVPSNRLESGQAVILTEGDPVPADGIMSEGDVLVNEAILTGESEPVQKKEGDELSAGSIIAQGNGVMMVTRSGSGSYISRLMDMVRKSQSEKPPIHKLSDKVSSIFIPVVLVLALLTFLVNYYAGFTDAGGAVLRAVAVLVIACPCAMGLATPTAIMVGSGWAVKKGVVFRHGPAFEEINHLDYMVLDKTGTLTEGEFSVQIQDGPNAEKYLPWVLALEQRSSHPIARSLVKFINEQYPDIKAVKLRKVREIKGEGIEGYDKEGRYFHIGGGSEVEGRKVVELKMDDEVVLKMLVGDRLKQGVLETIEYLKSEDIEPVILSGDKEMIVRKLASKLEIDQFFAEKLPEEKLEILTKLQKKGKTGAIGDGINDAAAIAQANVGIAFTSTSHLNIDSADIVLLSSDIGGLAKAVMVSRKTYQTIKQNLFWAFSYNIVAIPLAAIGLLSPIAAVAFMAFSDLVVIGNALLLRRRLDRNQLTIGNY